MNVVEGADLLIGRVFPAERWRHNQEFSPQVLTFVDDCFYQLSLTLSVRSPSKVNLISAVRSWLNKVQYEYKLE